MIRLLSVPISPKKSMGRTPSGSGCWQRWENVCHLRQCICSFVVVVVDAWVFVVPSPYFQYPNTRMLDSIPKAMRQRQRTRTRMLMYEREKLSVCSAVQQMLCIVERSRSWRIQHRNRRKGTHKRRQIPQVRRALRTSFHAICASAMCPHRKPLPGWVSCGSYPVGTRRGSKNKSRVHA